MHLDSLTIKNFRVLEDIHVNKLGHVNLIVGKNNSGKSTVLEALALLASGFEREILNRVLHNRNVGRHSVLQENRNSDTELYTFSNISSLFAKDKNEVFIGESNLFYISLTQDGDIFSHASYDSAEYKYYIGGHTLSSSFEIPYIKNLDSFNNQTNDYVIDLSFIDTNSIDISELANMWENILLTEAEDVALQMLRIIEPNILDLAFLNQDNQRVPYVRLANSKQRTPLHQMGDGIFRLLQIILKVLKAKDGFLLIDEFENGLHYSVQPDVWRLIFKLAKAFNIQVFATTHSWDCIESFAEVAKESELDGVLFRLGRSVRKSDNGKVIATEFDEDELYNMTKMQMEVR